MEKNDETTWKIIKIEILGRITQHWYLYKVIYFEINHLLWDVNKYVRFMYININ